MDTFGWDTVFVTTIDEANRALRAAADKLLLTFSFEADGVQIHGTFDPWRIIPGGSGRLLRLMLPIRAGKISGPSGAPANLAWLALVVEVSLALVPADTGGTTQQLKFDFQSAGDVPDDSKPGVVTPRALIDSDGRLSSMQSAILQTAICKCLVANAASVSYVFATINLVPPATNGWLTPVHSDYYYADAGDGSTGYLAILSVTSDRDISQLDRKIDPTLITDSSSMFFAVSPELFLKNVIQPAIPGIFWGTPPEMFDCKQGTNLLQNVDSFDMPTIDFSAFCYSPTVTNANFSVYDVGIACHAEGSCDMGWEFSCSFSGHSQSNLQFDPNNKSLQFLPDPYPQFTHEVSPSWIDDIPLVNLIVEAFGNGIAEGIQEESPFCSLAREPPQSVEWNGVTGCDVKEAGLAYCFYMRGVPQAP